MFPLGVSIWEAPSKTYPTKSEVLYMVIACFHIFWISVMQTCFRLGFSKHNPMQKCLIQKH